ncbi:MAG: protease modulator HflK [Gemmatales bacterium]
MKRWLLALILLLIVGYALTGLFQVAPGEWAVVRRCGQPLAELRGPGLHWGLPWGLDRVDRVAVDEQRQLALGFVEDVGPNDSLTPINPSTPTGQALTGDNQIVNLRISIQYRINRDQLVNYVLIRDNIEEILARAAEETLTTTLASEQIDQVLLGRSAALESRLRERLADRIKPYQIGVIIDMVNLVFAQPPAELIEIFRDVNRARSQRDIALTDANAKRNADISQAKQEADRVISLGQANANARLTQAKSEADAFRSLIATFPTTEPAVTAALLQLYLSEMQSILARMQVRTLSDQGVEQVVVVPLPK